MNLAFISHSNIRIRYHCNYGDLHLNDKSATLFTKNIVSALNKVAWPQNAKQSSSSKSFFDSDDIGLKEMLSSQLKVLKQSTLKIYFLVIWM